MQEIIKRSSSNQTFRSLAFVRFAAAVRAENARLLALRELDLDSDRTLSRILLRHQMRYSSQRTRRWEMLVAAFLIASVLAIFCYVMSSGIIDKWMVAAPHRVWAKGGHPPIGTAIWLWVGALVALGLIILAIRLIDSIPKSARIPFLVAAFALPYGLAEVYLLSAARGAGYMTDIAFGAGVLSIGVTTSIGGVLCVILISMRVAILFGWQNNPDTDFIRPMLKVLGRTRELRDWRNLDMRARSIKNLEQAANAIEWGLPRRLGVNDAIRSADAIREAKSMAASVRELKRWVATPTPTTREDLINRLVHDIRSVALGNWDELPRSERVHQSKRERLFTWVAEFTRVTLTAFTPAAALMIVARMCPDVPKLLMNTAYVIATFWALITFMHKLDPLLPNRTEANRNFLSVFLPSLRRKD